MINQLNFNSIFYSYNFVIFTLFLVVNEKQDKFENKFKLKYEKYAFTTKHVDKY